MAIIRKRKTGSVQKAPSIVKVKATVTIETAFAEYETLNSNELALNQIRAWIEETLDETESIPLFVNSQAGEETQPKKIRVKVDRVKSSRHESQRE